MSESLIYLDNAATTFPKPASALRRMVETYLRMGVSPGRGSYDLAAEAEHGQRHEGQVARFFGAPDPDRMIFTANATDALNIALQGMLTAGRSRRFHPAGAQLGPPAALPPASERHRDYDLVPFDSRGFVDPGRSRRGDQARYAARLRMPRLQRARHGPAYSGNSPSLRRTGGAPARRRGTNGRCDSYRYDCLGRGGDCLHRPQVDARSDRHRRSRPQPGVEIEPTRFGGTGVDSKTLVHTQTFPHRLEAERSIS